MYTSAASALDVAIIEPITFILGIYSSLAGLDFSRVNFDNPV